MVERKKVGGFSGQYFRIFLNLIILLCCCYILPSAQYGGYTWPMLTANSILESFLKYK